MATLPLPVTGNDDADTLLAEDPLALLMGMLLDQQVPMERAFLAPFTLTGRLGRSLDATAIAAMDPDGFLEIFCRVPALHRFPGSMGKRVQAMCQVLVDDYNGRAQDVWEGAADGADLLARLRALPGFGEEKSRIFVALLAKRFGVKPKGWQEAAGPFADKTPRSVADIDSRASFERVRAWKKEQKAKGLRKSD